MRTDQIEMEAAAEMAGINRKITLGLITDAEFERYAAVIFHKCKIRSLAASDESIKIGDA